MASRAHADPVAEDVSVSEKVVSAVATERDAAPTDLEPLFAAIDPDALDGLYGRSGSDSHRSPDRLSFRFGGCEVTVDGDGSVTAKDLAPDDT